MKLAQSIIDNLSNLEDIYTTLRKNGITFSKTQAVKIVGSRRTLEKLVDSGKIRVTKYDSYQKGRWECNAEDVLRFASNN